MGENEININWSQLFTCNYCKSQSWFGTHAAYEACINRESPYSSELKHSKEEHQGLSRNERATGCEKIEFRGEKIHPLVFKYIPHDSHLRNLDLKDVVEGYREDMDLSSDVSSEELVKSFLGEVADFTKLLKKHGSLKYRDGEIEMPDSD